SRFAPAAALASLAFAACGGAITNAPTATPTSTPSPSATATTSAATSGNAWTVTSASKATVRVREQLVGVSLPSDAVLTGDGGTRTATATANPTWKFADFGLRAPSVPFRVVSVTDEIKLIVDLVATGPVA